MAVSARMVVMIVVVIIDAVVGMLASDRIVDRVRFVRVLGRISRKCRAEVQMGPADRSLSRQQYRLQTDAQDKQHGAAAQGCSTPTDVSLRGPGSGAKRADGQHEIAGIGATGAAFAYVQRRGSDANQLARSDGRTRARTPASVAPPTA